MSDPTKPVTPEPLNRLTTEEAGQYIREVHVNPCPSCGSRSWQVINPPGDSNGFVLFYPAKRLNNGRLFPANLNNPSVLATVVARCAVCGLLQTYDTSNIEAWRKNR
jgi:hypothetical protein